MPRIDEEKVAYAKKVILPYAHPEELLAVAFFTPTDQVFQVNVFSHDGHGHFTHLPKKEKEFLESFFAEKVIAQEKWEYVLRSKKSPVFMNLHEIGICSAKMKRSP